MSTHIRFGLVSLFIAALFIVGVSLVQAQEVPVDEQTTQPQETVVEPTPAVDEAQAPTEEPVATEPAPADPAATEAPTEPTPEITTESIAEPVVEPTAPSELAQAPELSTDKADYAPGETATIWGKFFGALQHVLLTIVGQNEDGTEATTHTWEVDADDAGAFETTYNLINSYVPLYLLAANSSTGEVLAETSFTDANLNIVVAGAGTGTGTVTAPGSGSTGISCTTTAGATSGDCAGSEGGGTASKTLTATPASGSTFVGWTGTGFTCNGTGTCTISTSGNLNVTVTATFSLNVVKTNPTLSISNSPVTYNGSAQAATVNGSVAGTVSDVKYDGSATVPTAAGTYAVTADFVPTDTTNYNNLNDASAGNFVISQASSATVVTCPASVVYNGSAQTPCSAAVTGAGLSTTATVVYGNNTNVGTAAADASYAGDTNHTGSTATQKTFSITPATAICSVSGYSGTYDAAAHGATGSCTGVGSDLTPSGLDLGSSFTDVPGGTANWSFVNGNYNSQNGSVSIVITKADALVSVSGYTGTYDGATHGASGTATGVGGADLSSGLDLGASFTDVPGGTANWTFTGGTNYDDENGSVAIVISQAPSVTAITCPVSVVYNGSAQTPCSAAVTGAGLSTTATVVYGNNTNVGTATADASYAGDTNHTSSSDSKTFAITKADPVCTITGYTVTYDGNPHTATGSCLGVLGETLAGLELSGTTHTSALGSPFIDTWTFTDVTGNYNNDSDTVTDTINKANQTITFGDLANKIFGSPDFSLTATASSGLGVSFSSETPATCTVTVSTVHLIGLANSTCTIKASQGGNADYNAATEVTKSFQILPYGVPKTLPPISMSRKDFQKGSTIPVKFNIKSTVDGSLVTWATGTLDINTNPAAGVWTPAVSSGGSNTNNLFRSGDQYVFNLSTKMTIFQKGSNYLLRITLNDGEVILQPITIK